MELEFIQFRDWLDEAGGGNWPGLVEAERAGETTWLLAFDDAITVAVEWLEGPAPRVTLSSPLGIPPVDRRFVVYETLLSLNALWRENGAVRAALEAEGEVVLGICADLGDETRGGLQQLVASWRGVAREWQAFVNAPAETFTVPGIPISFLGLRA